MDDDPHQVLGLEPGATREQVERAYRFCLDLYADSALATYSLLDAEEVTAARRRVQDAYETLIRTPAPANGPGDPQPPAATAASDPVAAPAAPPALPTPPALRPPGVLPSPVTGAALRRYREERGVALRDIANETKIGVRFLEYIEADRHEMLPAVVYLRGFLQQYARLVGLEPRATAEGYLSRLRPES